MRSLVAPYLSMTSFLSPKVNVSFEKDGLIAATSGTIEDLEASLDVSLNESGALFKSHKKVNCWTSSQRP